MAPVASLTGDTAGNLYGTAQFGGTFNRGVLFKLALSGAYSVLHNFTGGPDGGAPYAGVIRDPAGNLYGTATGGGALKKGVIYTLDASGISAFCIASAEQTAGVRMAC